VTAAGFLACLLPLPGGAACDQATLLLITTLDCIGAAGLDCVRLGELNLEKVDRVVRRDMPLDDLKGGAPSIGSSRDIGGMIPASGGDLQDRSEQHEALASYTS
jgi:hypothetical protein